MYPITSLFTLLSSHVNINRWQWAIQTGLSQEDQLNALREKLALDLQVNRLYMILIVVVATSLVIILIITTYSFYRSRVLAAALDSQNQEIQRLNKVLEIKALRSQMDPHFVFNALNGLQHFLTAQHTEASDYLSKVARLIRFTLQNASKDWIKLQEEMEILKLYLQIEQCRFPGEFDFSFNIEPGLESEKIPFLVIQPYVENAVLHGLIPRKRPGGVVSIRACREGNLLKVIVEDNGVGRGFSKRTSDPLFTSMGSGLVRERLKQLSLQLGILLDVVTDDLKDSQGNPLGTRNTLSFEIQSHTKSIVAA